MPSVPRTKAAGETLLRRDYDLRLPEDKMQLFTVNKYTILNKCVQILLGDDSISSNQTFYPAVKTKMVKKKGKRR